MIGQPCPRHPDLALVAACDRCGDFGCKSCIPAGRSCVRCVPRWDVPKPDFSAATNVVFKDPRWLGKVFTGSLCLLLSVFLFPAFALMGYHARIARRQRAGVEPFLPEWDGVGELLWDGFKSYVAIALPSIFAYGVLIAGMAALAFTSMPPPGTKAPANPPPGFIGGMIVMMLAFYGFIFLYGLLVPAIQIEYLRTGSVLSAFHFSSIWRTISKHPVDYFIFFVIAMALYFLAAFAGELMCLVGLFFTMPVGLYVEGCYLGRYCAWLDAVDAAG